MLRFTEAMGEEQEQVESDQDQEDGGEELEIVQATGGIEGSREEGGTAGEECEHGGLLKN